MKVLSLNLGSSSLKCAVHSVSGGDAECVFARDIPTSSQPQAAIAAARNAIAEAIRQAEEPDAVGHRIVFGGQDDAPALITSAVLAKLESLQSLDPLHVPGALAVIRAAQDELPQSAQVACFDTAFFRDVPETARALPLPSGDPLLRRFGFHGLSYDSVRRALGSEICPRTVISHLGNGASAVALLNAQPVDMTMGFSPLGGILMSTRPGDIDPGVILYLLERDGISTAELRNMLETKSGLRALSAGEGDLRRLCTRDDADAKFAVEMFVRSVAKAIGALAIELRGLDLLVFTGGIGEHNAQVRDAIVSRIRILNPALDVRVVHSDENATIALHSAFVVSEPHLRQSADRAV
jgi:acetate kinase